MANTEKKLTKADHFTAIINGYPLTDEHKAFLEHELELLVKKNSAKSTKPTAKQTANAAIKQAVLDYMADNTLYTVGQLVKEVPDLPEDMTGQRMSALLTQLKDAGAIVRTEDKRKAYFSKA